MAIQESFNKVSYVAAADLSTRQFRFVDVNNVGRIVLVSAAGGRSVGVLQDKPGEATSAAGERGAVGIDGKMKVVAAGAITAGTEIKSDNEGRATSAATEVDNHYVLGVATSTVTAAGQLVEFQSYIYRQQT